MNDTDPAAPSLEQAQFLRIAFTALTAKAARWVTLLLTFGLFAVAIGWPSWMRLAIAATFALMVHAPMWWRVRE